MFLTFPVLDHSSDIMVKCEEQYGLDGNMYSPSYHDSIVIGKVTEALMRWH